MNHYEYKTSGTCSQFITFDLDGDAVRNVVFYGGCPGNLKAIPILVEGMNAEELVEKLKDVKCGFKDTSCAGQLAIAVAQAYQQQAQG